MISQECQRERNKLIKKYRLTGLILQAAVTESNVTLYPYKENCWTQKLNRLLPWSILIAVYIMDHFIKWKLIFILVIKTISNKLLK